MQCPKCRSDYLMIRQKTGLERFMIYLTGLREYRCRDCDQKFRAPDRRLRPRHADKPVRATAGVMEKPLAGMPSRAT